MSEFRRDIVTGQWVIIAGERGKRPSDFKLRVQREKNASCPFSPVMKNILRPRFTLKEARGAFPGWCGWFRTNFRL